MKYSKATYYVDAARVNKKADMRVVLRRMNASMQHRVLLNVVERGIMAARRKSYLFACGKT